MSELGRLLERFYGLEPTFHTVRSRIRHTKKASVEGASATGTIVIGRRKYNAKSEDEPEETLSMWAIPPDHVRIETERTREDHVEYTSQVSNSDNFWNRFANGTVEQGSRSSLPITYQRHFDRGLIRKFFAALTLESIGSIHVANRECLRIRAVKIPESQLWPHWLAWEADEFEFAVDTERAVLLSIVGKVAGQATEQHEVEEVVFDEDLDQSLFTYEVQPDEKVEPATPIAENISLNAAISRVSFTVLQPMWLPDRDKLQCEILYHRARPNCPDEHLSLIYRGGKLFDHLWINQRPELEKGLLSELEWEGVEIHGRALKVSDPSPEEGLRVVMFEQDRTFVDIISDMPREELLEVAASFECAKG